MSPVMLWHLLRLNIYYNPRLLVPYKPSLSGIRNFAISSFIAGWICINDESKFKDGRKKTMMFYLCQDRYKDDWRKSVTPSIVRHE